MNVQPLGIPLPPDFMESLRSDNVGSSWSELMPIISMFNGIIVRMYFFDTKQHARPHVHAQYGEFSAVFAIEDGTLLAGSIPSRQTRLIQAWIELRREDLAADWILATNGATLLPIEPLR